MTIDSIIDNELHRRDQAEARLETALDAAEEARRDALLGHAGELARIHVNMRRDMADAFAEVMGRDPDNREVDDMPCTGLEDLLEEMGGF